MKRKIGIHFYQLSLSGTMAAALLWCMFTAATSRDANHMAGPPSLALSGVQETVLDSTSFASDAAFNSKWNYLYPWGADHNGTARMRQSNMTLAKGVLTIVATPTRDAGNSDKDPYLPIHYYSGACYAKPQIVISDQFPEYEISIDAQVPTGRGTWPAFWITGADSWPPESDIMEFKGNDTCWQNTYTGRWQEKLTRVSSADQWHHYRARITKVNSTDADIHYYIDGAWMAVHRATNFAGKPMWVIINLQMEGSSNAPGPTGTTYYRTKNPYVSRTKAF